MASERPAPGIQPLGPSYWELVVDAGRDPLTGKRRRLTRRFRGNLNEAKRARAALLVEVDRGTHDGTRATVDFLFREWIKELERKGRAPSTIAGYSSHYGHSIRPTLGSVEVRKVTTKMLTDLYGAHQGRGVKPGTVYQIHAVISSMMTQACRWGWRDSNPAQWAEPPRRADEVPIVPTPDEVLALIEAARNSRRPVYARAMMLAATTGIRRGELCAIRRDRNVDWENGVLRVTHSITDLPKRPLSEGPTKNRQRRVLAIGTTTMGILEVQLTQLEDRATACKTDLVKDPYLFSDAVDGSKPLRPGAITLYFARLRVRAGLGHLHFKSLRRFMATYGQDLGFSLKEVAMRAGHDPAVAGRYYSGAVVSTDRRLAEAIDALLEQGR